MFSLVLDISVIRICKIFVISKFLGVQSVIFSARVNHCPLMDWFPDLFRPNEGQVLVLMKFVLTH